MKKIDKRGYVRYSDDPTRRAWEHIRVAEHMLGRCLGVTEQVHHINGNKTDNREENLMVLRTNKDHKLIHSKLPCYVLKTPDGSCVVVKQQRTCVCCGRLFEPKTNRYVYCSLACARNDRPSRIPPAAVLQKQVWEVPATQLAKIYNVSDRAIGKWCAKLNIAKPGRGYWAKLKAQDRS